MEDIKPEIESDIIQMKIVTVITLHGQEYLFNSSLAHPCNLFNSLGGEYMYLSSMFPDINSGLYIFNSVSRSVIESTKTVLLTVQEIAKTVQSDKTGQGVTRTGR